MPDIKQLALKLATDGPVRTLATPRQIRGILNGSFILRTTSAVLVWEIPFYPQLYIPKTALLTTSSNLEAKQGQVITSPSGTTLAHQWTLSVRGKSTDQAVIFSDTLSGPGEALRGLAKIDFAALDQWFEEDTPIFVHPKDPFKRVDILASTRRVCVSVGGMQVADAVSSMHLYETGLPPRYYLPLTAVKTELLRPSGTRTRCPYKGEAEYYSVEVEGKVFEDVVWYYRNPTLESAKIEGLLCFYNEKVDIELDGEKLEKPVTHFSKGKPNDKPSAV